MYTIKNLTTKEKALKLNLNDKIYGTFAEIGGGQEVAEHFFKAGAASGTVAKTMSAYDMIFSDAIYGKSDRYVCEDKLIRMLNKEYTLLSQRLTHRAKRSQFFAFANTVEVLNYNKSNIGHGWIGIRFQLHPCSAPNDCIIHVLLKDAETNWQQQVLGIVGVNLIFGCYNISEPEDLINSLKDNISSSRFEIDMFRLTGPDFHHVDNRLMSLILVKNGLTHAAMFDPKGNVLQPSEVLYKKNVLVLRGRFRPVTLVQVDMMISGIKQVKKDGAVDKEKLLILSELTLNDLTMGGEVDETDFLDRVDLLSSLGQNVMISNYQEHYKLAAYLSKFTKKRRIGIILGVNNLERIFDERYYESLDGGILESFSRLFGSNVKLLIYPSLKHDSKELYSLKDFVPPSHLKSLFQYFIENGNIEAIENPKHEHLHIASDKILKMIKNGDNGWEEMVPFKVCQAIKENHLFEYPAPTPFDVDVDMPNS